MKTWQRGTLAAVGAALLVFLAVQAIVQNPSGGSPGGSSGSATSTATGRSKGGAYPDLDLTLTLLAGGNGTYSAGVGETNLASVALNASVGDAWPFPPAEMDPYDGCGAYSFSPIGLAVLQGHYALSNFSLAEPLTLYNTTYAYTCTQIASQIASYVFAPNSSAVNVTDSSGRALLTNWVPQFAYALRGYWTGGQGTGQAAQFHPFFGEYTVVAADEWGGVVLAYLSVE